MRKKPAVYSNVPFVDYWLGRLAMKILAKLAIRAIDRKDYHEFNHTLLGLSALNSDHIETYLDKCIVPATKPIARGETFLVTIPNPPKRTK